MSSSGGLDVKTEVAGLSLHDGHATTMDENGDGKTTARCSSCPATKRDFFKSCGLSSSLGKNRCSPLIDRLGIFVLRFNNSAVEQYKLTCSTAHIQLMQIVVEKYLAKKAGRLKLRSQRHANPDLEAAMVIFRAGSGVTLAGRAEELKAAGLVLIGMLPRTGIWKPKTPQEN